MLFAFLYSCLRILLDIAYVRVRVNSRRRSCCFCTMSSEFYAGRSIGLS